MISNILRKLRLPFSGQNASEEMEKGQDAQNKQVDTKLKSGFSVLKHEKRNSLPHQSGKPSWYLMLGASHSGKTSLLHSVGLADALSATENIECLPAEYTMFLDTAGRYFSERDSHAQWLVLLKSLRKRKRRFPCAGIIVVLDAGKWCGASEDALRAEAQQLSRRLAEVFQALKQSVPIYLVFSKCDELPGYHHFFSTSHDAPQAPSWKISALDKAPLTLAQIETQLSRELKALQACRVEKVSQQTDLFDKHAAYRFPEHFASITHKVNFFIKTLLKFYGHQKINLRSLYFTSALQQSNQRLFDEIAAEKNTAHLVPYANAMRMAVAAAVAFAAIALFQLAFSLQVSSLKAAQTSLTRLAEAAAPFYPDDLAIVLSIDEVFQHYQQLQEMEEQATWQTRLGFHHTDQQLAALHPFLIRILEERFFKESALSLYDELDSYNRRWPRASQAEQALMRGQYYDTLKACLMLEFSEHVELNFVGNMLIEFWKTRLFKYGSRAYPDTRLTRKTLGDLAFFYLDYLKAERGMNLLSTLLAYSDAIVREARRQLHVTVEANTLYQRMVLQSRPAWGDTSIRELMDAEDLVAPWEERTFLEIYTQRGWEEYVHPAIEQLALDAQRDDWVLYDPVFAHVLYTGLETRQASERSESDSDVSVDQLIRDMREFYFTDYLSTWSHALSKLVFKPFTSMNEAAKQLPAFLGAQGTIWQLIELLDRQLSLTEPEGSHSGGSVNAAVVPEFASLSGDLRRLILPVKGSDAPLIASPLSRLLAIQPELQSLALSKNLSKGALTLVRETLAGEKQEAGLYQSASEADFFLQGLRDDLTDILTPLLIEPIKRVWHLILNEAAPALNQRWQEKVYAEYDNYLKNHFPFQPFLARDDASPEKAAAFFQPETGKFWQFVNEELADVIEGHEETWRVKTWLGSGLPLSAALLKALPYANAISHKLFSLDDEIPSLAFELYLFPTTGLREIKFVVSDEVYRYYNGPQAWQAFTWRYDDLSASMCIFATLTGEHPPLERCEQGPWAPIRLMRAAQLSGGEVGKASDDFLEAVWHLRGAGSNTATVKAHFRMQDNSPAENLFWSEFQLPELIV